MPRLCLLALGLLFGTLTTVRADAYVFSIDDLTLVDDGVMTFHDGFDDGLAPGVGFAPTYIGPIIGGLTETGGKLVLDGAVGGDISGVDPAFHPGHMALPLPFPGLMSPSDIELTSTWDLVLPGPGEVFGIGMIVPGVENPFVFVYSDAGGIRAGIGSWNGDAILTVGTSVALDPTGRDQIRLHWSHSVADPGTVTGSFDLLSGGAVVESGLSIGTFSDPDALFGLPYYFAASLPEPSSGALLVLGIAAALRHRGRQRSA